MHRTRSFFRFCPSFSCDHTFSPVLSPYTISIGYCSTFAKDGPTIVVQSSKLLQNQAKSLAKTLAVPFISTNDDIPIDNEVFILQYGSDKIQFVVYEKKGKKMKQKTCFSCDFDDTALQSRIRNQTATKSPLLKALGISPGDTASQNKFSVLDATTGLAEDSFLIAQYASNVTMVERSPLLYALLEDGLKRGRESPNYVTRLTTEKMKLYKECCDSALVFDRLLEYHPTMRPNIIFLDPMHEEKYGKSALPKFKIQLARKLVGRGNEEDHTQLLQTARTVATQRVVFKKPSNAPTDPSASFSVSGGRAVRYDVYKNSNST